MLKKLQKQSGLGEGCNVTEKYCNSDVHLTLTHCFAPPDNTTSDAGREGLPIPNPSC